MRLILFALLLSLPQIAQGKDRIIEGMTALKGKPIRDLFAMIGSPDRQEDFLGSKVFFWEPKTIADAIPCRLKVEINPDLTISSWHYEGSEFGCQTLSDRFKRATAPRH